MDRRVHSAESFIAGDDQPSKCKPWVTGLWGNPRVLDELTRGERGLGDVRPLVNQILDGTQGGKTEDEWGGELGRVQVRAASLSPIGHDHTTGGLGQKVRP